jgi:hypothetical protein
MNRALAGRTWISGSLPLGKVPAKVRRSGLNGAELFAASGSLAPADACAVPADHGPTVFSVTSDDAGGDPCGASPGNTDCRTRTQILNGTAHSGPDILKTNAAGPDPLTSDKGTGLENIAEAQRAFRDRTQATGGMKFG